MFYIHRQKITVFFFTALAMLMMANTSDAQIKRGSNYNYNEFSKKPYYFGITLAYNNSKYNMFYSDDFILNDSISTARSVSGPGFNIGVVTNLKVGKYFDFRLLPTLSFAERIFTFDNVKGTNFRERKVNSTFAELPFHVRYKSAPYKDMRLFLLAGVKYSYDLSSNSRTRQANTLIKISPTDFQVEYGVGMQFFMPFFIFSPEFKVSHGVSNILLYNPDLDESSVIEKILSRAFTISLHFEG